ncbi:MAG: XRE family transcriptional regulator [Gemmiger sp.]|uniref:XRE family transcriptional regulator n=1 Tax=Gemmiger sp. TaxID=2049027 RepID=UPI002E7923C7|nr:XRE family transcriptional regulator [Gemmiger sp.]MEE0708921.1 XRE family transcriptional regulator [Gemmiger sp.]
MSWRERIRQARESQKLTREQVVSRMHTYLPADKAVVARTLAAWEGGDREPRVTQAIALAKALGYHEVSDLFYDSDEAQLNKLGLDRLEEYRSLLLRSPQFRETVQPVLRLLPVYLQPASAGTGQWLDDDLSEEMEVDDSVPASAEFGVRLAGDSMSPRFADGQIVWARKTETAENGEIVLCVLNDQGYCKKLHRDEHGVSLISLNPKYDPISITEVDEFRIMGCVVG